MQRFARVLMASFIVLLLWSPNSFAVGVGTFVDASAGSGEAEWDSDYYSWDIDSNAAALGFVLDTAPTNESVFNYRLNIGFARHELEDEYGDMTLKSNGVYAENIFGFAFVRNENFRWWAGPLIRVGYYTGDTGNSYRDIDVDYAEFGMGGVTGLNFNVGGAILAPSVGFRFSGFAGEGEGTDLYGYSWKEDIEAFTSSVFANFAVLF